MTPLKKRRFARESLSVDAAPTPSTSCSAAADPEDEEGEDEEEVGDGSVATTSIRNGFKVPAASDAAHSPVANDNLFEVR